MTHRHKDVILLTKMELSWFLPRASLGPQVKDHTTWFLPKVSLGPQVKSSRRWSCHEDIAVTKTECQDTNVTKTTVLSWVITMSQHKGKTTQRAHRLK